MGNCIIRDNRHYPLTVPNATETDDGAMSSADKIKLDGLSVGGLAGDGSSGTLDFNGVNTFVTLATKVGSVYDLGHASNPNEPLYRQDIFADKIIVRAGITVNFPRGRLFAKTSITVETGGRLSADGNPGTSGDLGGTGGAAAIGVNVGSCAGGGAGGTSGGAAPQTGTANGGVAPGNSPHAYFIGSSGNNGGDSGDGNVGQIGGAIIGGYTTTARIPRCQSVAEAGQSGAGSGGGAGAADNSGFLGGGGGAGGSVMYIDTPNLVNNGRVSADGGPGGDGDPTPGAAAGGGSGGGAGTLFINAAQISGSGVFSAAGGVGGAETPGGGGQPGQAGSASVAGSNHPGIVFLAATFP